jgi:hypothetical protein
MVGDHIKINRLERKVAELERRLKEFMKDHAQDQRHILEHFEISHKINDMNFNGFKSIDNELERRFKWEVETDKFVCNIFRLYRKLGDRFDTLNEKLESLKKSSKKKKSVRYH